MNVVFSRLKISIRFRPKKLVLGQVLGLRGQTLPRIPVDRIRFRQDPADPDRRVEAGDADAIPVGLVATRCVPGQIGQDHSAARTGGHINLPIQVLVGRGWSFSVTVASGQKAGGARLDGERRENPDHIDYLRTIR